LCDFSNSNLLEQLFLINYSDAEVTLSFNTEQSGISGPNDVGSSNPGQSGGSGSSNPGQSGGSGSNNPGQSGGSGPNNIADATQVMNQADFDKLRKSTADKLLELYRQRPYNGIHHKPFNLYMNDPAYQDRINDLDHNVVCRHILDTEGQQGVARSYRNSVTQDAAGKIKYTGVVSRPLIDHLMP
jgi:hypothetical protein